MQIKPRFKQYKELYRIPFRKDDRGIKYDFVNYEGIDKDGKKVKGFRIMSRQLINHQNGATSYDTEMYFKKSICLAFPIEFKGYYFYAVYRGDTRYIDNGIRIGFLKQKQPLKHRIIRKLYPFYRGNKSLDYLLDDSNKYE